MCCTDCVCTHQSVYCDAHITLNFCSKTNADYVFMLSVLNTTIVRIRVCAVCERALITMYVYAVHYIHVAC
jgi:hypothetical protein